MSWYYAVGDDRKGPVEEAEFQQLVAQGVIRADTLVWQNGMANWRAYRELGVPGPAAAVPDGNRIFCQECGQAFGRNDLIQLGGRYICGNCKQKVVQKMQEGGSSTDESIRNDHLRHEASLQSAGILYFLGGGLFLVLALALFFAGGDGWMGGVFFLLIAIGTIWTAVNLRKLKPSARVPVGLISGFGLLWIPIGTLIHGYILHLVFSKKGTFIMSEEYQGIRERTPHIKYRSSPLVVILLVILLGMISLGIVGALMSGR